MEGRLPKGPAVMGLYSGLKVSCTCSTTVVVIAVVVVAAVGGTVASWSLP